MVPLVPGPAPAGPRHGVHGQRAWGPAAPDIDRREWPACTRQCRRTPSPCSRAAPCRRGRAPPARCASKHTRPRRQGGCGLQQRSEPPLTCMEGGCSQQERCCVSSSPWHGPLIGLQAAPGWGPEPLHRNSPTQVLVLASTCLGSLRLTHSHSPAWTGSSPPRVSEEAPTVRDTCFACRGVHRISSDRHVGEDE